jgi:hypothetical protein
METTRPNVYLARDGILRIDYRASKRITIDVVRKAYELHFQLSPAKRPVLIFGQNVLSMDHEVATFASGEEVCSVTKAAAILAKSFLEEQMGNMYLAWRTPPFPTRLFTSESAALRWLVPYANE